MTDPYRIQIISGSPRHSGYVIKDGNRTLFHGREFDRDTAQMITDELNRADHVARRLATMVVA